MTLGPVDVARGWSAAPPGAPPAEEPAAARWRGADLLRGLVANPPALAGLTMLALMVLVALAAPWISPYDPIRIAPGERLRPPSGTHLLGTDEIGRDLLSRIFHGARVSLWVGLIVVGLAGSTGTLIGVVAGYARGAFDTVAMRFVDIILAFPGLLLAMAIASSLGPGLTNAMLAVAFVATPGYARLARSQALAIRELQYVEAARALGVPTARIVLRHVLPNCLSPLLVLATMGMGSAILTAASLSFIGLGAQPPTPEWGAMVASGREFLLDHWWYAIFPGLAIFLTVVSFNLVGDWLRDTLDPRLRK
jgi:peptide/nickel transport system permease protein